MLSKDLNFNNRQDLVDLPGQWHSMSTAMNTATNSITSCSNSIIIPFRTAKCQSFFLSAYVKPYDHTTDDIQCNGSQMWWVASKNVMKIPLFRCSASIEIKYKFYLFRCNFRHHSISSVMLVLINRKILLILLLTVLQVGHRCHNAISTCYRVSE